MTEFMAGLRYLWIEHGDKAAVVLIVVIGLLLLAISGSGKVGNQRG